MTTTLLRITGILILLVSLVSVSQSRYYDFDTGRFLQIDPHPQGIWSENNGSGYTAFRGDPWNRRDPLGLQVSPNQAPAPEQFQDDQLFRLALSLHDICVTRNTADFNGWGACYDALAKVTGVYLIAGAIAVGSGGKHDGDDDGMPSRDFTSPEHKKHNEELEDWELLSDEERKTMDQIVHERFQEERRREQEERYREQLARLREQHREAQGSRGLDEQRPSAHDHFFDAGQEPDYADQETLSLLAGNPEKQREYRALADEMKRLEVGSRRYEEVSNRMTEIEEEAEGQ